MKYTVIITPNDQIVTKKNYYMDDLAGSYLELIKSDYPNFKTTLDYAEFNKLKKYLIHNWGLSEQQVLVVEKWNKSDKLTLSFKDLVK